MQNLTMTKQNKNGGNMENKKLYFRQDDKITIYKADFLKITAITKSSLI